MSYQKTAVDVLRDARALIEKGWTQGAYAKDANGNESDWGDAKAVCFCAYGAIYRAQGSDVGTLARKFMLEAVQGPVATWNDTPGRKKAEVLAAFDKAIELAQAEQTA